MLASLQRQLHQLQLQQSIYIISESVIYSTSFEAIVVKMKQSFKSYEQSMNNVTNSKRV